MFEGLASAVDELDVSVDSVSLASLIAIKDRLDAKLVGAVAEFDRDALWAFDQAASLHAWLRFKGRCSDRDAARFVDTARKLREMPAVYSSWCEGRLSSGHVDVIRSNITRRTLPVFAGLDAELCAQVERQDIAEAKRTMRHVAAVAEDMVDDGSGNTDGASRPNRLSVSKTLDGRGYISGDLDTETRELVETALTLADSKDLDTPTQQRRGDALRDVCRFFLDNHAKADAVAALPGQRRNRPHLHFIIGADGRGETEDGVPVPKSTVERLICDARVNTVKFSDGQVLYYGKSYRTAPDHLFDALVVRDRGCRFPGCGRPARWTNAHHVVAWDPTSGDGPTDIDNLVLLCGVHHHTLHRSGWHAKLLPNAVFEVTSPQGVVTSTGPPGDPDAEGRRLIPF